MKGLNHTLPCVFESATAQHLSYYISLWLQKTILKFPRVLRVLEMIFFLNYVFLVQADNGSQVAAFVFVWGN